MKNLCFNKPCENGDCSLPIPFTKGGPEYICTCDPGGHQLEIFDQLTTDIITCALITLSSHIAIHNHFANCDVVMVTVRFALLPTVCICPLNCPSSYIKSSLLYKLFI